MKTNCRNGTWDYGNRKRDTNKSPQTFQNKSHVLMKGVKVHIELQPKTQIIQQKACQYRKIHNICFQMNS